MNFLVVVDTRAGELEKILSGVKTMLIKECDPAQDTVHPICPGDNLYFLRDQEDCTLRVKATVVRILTVTNNQLEDQSQTYKEMQTRLQQTEEQYNYWSVRKQALLVEFEFAQKIGVIPIAPEMIPNRSDWIAFEDLHQITKQED